MTTTTRTIAYKVFTHDLRSPIQGGEPIWDGKLPFTLPARTVDTSGKDCAEGWNAARLPHVALQIAGLWGNGHPSRLFRVETDMEIVERGEKLRASTWDILGEIHDFAGMEGRRLTYKELIANV